MKKLSLVLLIFSWGYSTKADSVQVATLQVVTQEIKAGSSLTLKQGVALTWAEDLLYAQQNATYASATSLALSISAVLKAISLEGSIAGFTWCGLSNCVWVNQQALIAVDPNAGIVVTPSALIFSDIPVGTPDPAVWLLIIAGSALVLIACAVYKVLEPRPRL